MYILHIILLKNILMNIEYIFIGQKSFAFGHDGDLIEIDSSNSKRSFEDTLNSDTNVMKSLEAKSSDLTSDDIKVFKQTTIQKIEKVLPKSLYFNDDKEFNNTDFNLLTKTFKENLNEQNLDKNINCKDDISLNTISHNIFDIRRASDGFCNMKDGKILSEINKRRHSDGFMQTSKHNDDNILARRRKTLKRQTRINDIDDINYCDLNICESDTAQCKEYNLNNDDKQKNISTKLIQNDDKKIQLKSGTRNYDIIKYSQTFLEETHNCIKSINSSKEKQGNNSEYCIEKSQSIEQICVNKDESTTCCCHSGTKKYWKKMEKIMQENKNLENMVTKSRREMAEIREMLSSVLSVRLEPGF